MPTALLLAYPDLKIQRHLCDTDLSEPQSEATHGILTLICIMPESCLYVYLKMQQELSICKL